MHRVFISICCLIAATLFVHSNLSIANVNGPYNNSHTYVEYTTDEYGDTWLYAINAVNKPNYHGGGFDTYYLFNRMNGSSGEWESYPFVDETEEHDPMAHGFPSLLGWSDYPSGIHNICMVAAFTETGDFATTRRDTALASPYFRGDRGQPR